MSSVPPAQLVAQMRPALLKYFRRKTQNAAEAEDLTQDVVLSALTHATWQNPNHAKGYIFRTAVNRWRDRNRRLQTHAPTTEYTDAIAARSLDEESTPERVLTAQQELHRVTTALSQLSERTRDVFILSRLENMKLAAIAEMFGISVSAVDKHLARALAHLASTQHSKDEPP